MWSVQQTPFQFRFEPSHLQSAVKYCISLRALTSVLVSLSAFDSGFYQQGGTTKLLGTSFAIPGQNATYDYVVRLIPAAFQPSYLPHASMYSCPTSPCYIDRRRWDSRPCHGATARREPRCNRSRCRSWQLLRGRHWQRQPNPSLPPGGEGPSASSSECAAVD